MELGSVVERVPYDDIVLCLGLTGRPGGGGLLVEVGRDVELLNSLEIVERVALFMVGGLMPLGRP